MYLVKGKMPKSCDKCNMSKCVYMRREDDGPGEVRLSPIDSQPEEPGTVGFVCMQEYEDFGMFMTVQRGEINKHVQKPKWCPCEEVPESIKEAVQLDITNLVSLLQ